MFSLSFFQAVLVLFVLVYIHVVFARNHLNCLAHIQPEWPRSGILRVEIVRNPPSNYSIADSYSKEYHDDSFYGDESDIAATADSPSGLGEVSSSETNESGKNIADETSNEANKPDMEQYWQDLSGGLTSNETDQAQRADLMVRRGLLFGRTMTEFEMLAKVG